MWANKGGQSIQNAITWDNKFWLAKEKQYVVCHVFQTLTMWAIFGGRN